MALDYSLRPLRNRRLRGRSEPKFPAPFVVGVGRSGTTLLRMMLDAHPQLAIPPETHFINPFIQASGRIRFNAKTACRTIVHDERRRWNDFGLAAEDLLERFQAVEPFNTSDALRAFYELYASKHGKPRWGDKTPDYIRKMKKIQKTLPEARFIHVIRDGRDAGLSQNSRVIKRGKEPVPPREMARRWRKRILKAHEDAEEVQHYLEVRYEDLVTDTEEVLRRVCEHVEIDYDPVMLRYYERAEERLQEMAGALPAKKGRPEREAGERVAAHALTTKPPDPGRVQVWKQEMSDAENAEFEEAAGHLLEELGYETVTPHDNWVPREEWARAKDRAERGNAAGGLLARLRGRGGSE
ncbi:MAG TPA: sulfotransferase [Solirubrobacterales bacterium]|nr:sulfotransferase [Solirubrobacterales bacterium]